MRNENKLPEEEELKDYGVKLKSKKGEDEVKIYGWAEEPSADMTASKLLKYRIAKYLVGYTTATGRKVKRYGIHLLVGLFILSIFIYGASRTAYFFDVVGVFTLFLIVFFMIFYFIHLKPEWVPMIQEVRKGEEIPIAIRDDNGKVSVVTHKAKTTYTNVLRVEEESLQYLIPFGVVEERSSNNKPVWKIKHFHYNMVWGSAMYEDYDVSHMDTWGEIISWLPSDVEEAMKRTEKYLKKENIPQEEIDFVKGKINEIYKAMSVVNTNEKEINEHYGKRLIKIKRTKENNAFFTAWSAIVKDIEAYHESRLMIRDAVNKQEENIMEVVNRARKVDAEYTYEKSREQGKLKEAMDTGYQLAMKQLASNDQRAYEQDLSARAPEIREADDITKRALQETLKKKIQEEIEIGETDTEF